jgi:hypothetical protein
METRTLDIRGIRDLSPQLLDAEKRLRIMPAAFYETTTSDERMLFAVRQGLYGLPTQELVDFLKKRIAGRSAIEIGAGAGVLAEALGIRGTDNWQQNEPTIRAYYDALKQPTVPYHPSVEKLTAAEAVAKYKPQVVVACWVTHRYDPARHGAGGNQDGVHEESIIANCEEYIVVGNAKVHANKSIWSLPHERHEAPWLYSRAGNGSKDFVAVWRNPARAVATDTRS